MTELACQQHPELYFAESPTALEAARAACTGCPVLDLCLAGARERREPHGVWGGQIFVAGEVVQHKRARGRPRKVA